MCVPSPPRARPRHHARARARARFLRRPQSEDDDDEDEQEAAAFSPVIVLDFFAANRASTSTSTRIGTPRKTNTAGTQVPAISGEDAELPGD
jgi:hypothetical protein